MGKACDEINVFELILILVANFRFLVFVTVLIVFFNHRALCIDLASTE